MSPRLPPLARDLVVVAAVTVGLASGSLFGKALAVAAAVAFLWGLVTLHYPTRVDLSDDGITFSAYGRSHHFRWEHVRRIHLRRFVVRDRVLVRLCPSSPWRGRYWLTTALADFDATVEALASRAR